MTTIASLVKGDIYTGIGSRETPTGIMNLMTDTACYLSRKGVVLRSGGADGADSSFEKGASTGLKEIYLPWKYFNKNASRFSARILHTCRDGASVSSGMGKTVTFGSDSGTWYAISIWISDVNSPIWKTPSSRDHVWNDGSI